LTAFFCPFLFRLDIPNGYGDKKTQKTADPTNHVENKKIINLRKAGKILKASTPIVKYLNGLVI
jgi:hypothetical protein